MLPYDHNHTNSEIGSLWGFTSLVPTERSVRLLGLKRYEEVLNEIILTSNVVGYEAEPFRSSRFQGCVRASFLLSVAPSAYDGFFNSPVGYRAQYCLGRADGELANRRTIEALRAKLMEYAKLQATGTFDLSRIAASLDAADAKIWIDESESVHSDTLEIHIDYLPWIERARRADATQEEEVVSAVRGVLAPVGTRLEVKGGWLSSDGSERRDPIKARRGEEIAMNGFT